MKPFLSIPILAFFVVSGMTQLVSAETLEENGIGPVHEGGSGSDSNDKDIPEFFVPPPPFTEGIFPCSDCHADMEVNETKREMEEFHEEIRIINHNEEERWCLDCHNPGNRDMLRLAGGRLINFEQSYYLCGQCHGTIFRDWKAGVHGRRTGDWNGKKIYRLCVHCHNPHQPRFKPLAPMPPPERPGGLR